jgi:hypothetical protein
MMLFDLIRYLEFNSVSYILIFVFPSLIPTIACDVLHLVLVKVPRAKIHTAQHVPWWQIKEAFSVGVVGKA